MGRCYGWAPHVIVRTFARCAKYAARTYRKRKCRRKRGLLINDFSSARCPRVLRTFATTARGFLRRRSIVENRGEAASRSPQNGNARFARKNRRAVSPVVLAYSIAFLRLKKLRWLFFHFFFSVAARTSTFNGQRVDGAGMRR